MKVYSLKILIIILCMSVGCAKNPTASEPTVDEVTQIPDFDDLVPDNGNNFSPPSSSLPQLPTLPSSQFETDLLKQGIQLSSRELQFLATFPQLEFKRWASTRSFSEQENLEKNFQRFQKFFKSSASVNTPSSVQEYKEQALKFANNTSGQLYLDTKFYLASKQLLVVKWASQSGEFVVVRSDGTIANYLISRAVTAPRYIKFDF